MPLTWHDYVCHTGLIKLRLWNCGSNKKRDCFNSSNSGKWLFFLWTISRHFDIDFLKSSICGWHLACAWAHPSVSTKLQLQNTNNHSINREANEVSCDQSIYKPHKHTRTCDYSETNVNNDRLTLPTVRNAETASLFNVCFLTTLLLANKCCCCCFSRI